MTVSVEHQTVITESLASDASWPEVGALVNDAMQKAETLTRQRFAGKKGFAISTRSTDTVLIDHSGERRFLITVVFEVRYQD